MAWGRYGGGMTTHQPPSQPSYLARLAGIGAEMSDTFIRLHELLFSIPQHGDEWNDCYRVHMALALTCSLVDDAKDRERARNAPVPFLPVEVIAQASAKLAEAVEGWDGQ